LPNDLSRYRLCVDTEEDFKLIERLLQNLIPQGDDFNLETVIKCLQAHPDWLALNQDIQQETGPFVGL
jgi:spore coat polysaccharide biosynthesis protein SpsF